MERGRQGEGCRAQAIKHARRTNYGTLLDVIIIKHCFKDNDWIIFNCLKTICYIMRCIYNLLQIHRFILTHRYAYAMVRTSFYRNKQKQKTLTIWDLTETLLRRKVDNGTGIWKHWVASATHAPFLHIPLRWRYRCSAKMSYLRISRRLSAHWTSTDTPS